MKKFSSSFFFSVKILFKDSILDSHRSHGYITFVVVRKKFHDFSRFCVLSTLKSAHFNTFSAEMKLKTIEFRWN